MATIQKKLALRWAPATVLLLAKFAIAQEPQQPTTEPSETRNSRLYFFDQPLIQALEFDDSIEFPFEQNALPEEDDPEFKRRLASINQYNEAVRATEFDGGVWDSSLTEDLTVLGSLLQQQGDHLQAIETFDRVVHISRINNGLDTLDQVPAVEQMIESYLAISDWEQADLYYNYLFYIQEKAYGSADPRIIPVIDLLATWNLRAFNIGFDEDLGERLSTAQILFSGAAQMVALHFGKSDERFTLYQRNIANTAYLVAKHPDLMRNLNSVDFRMNEEALRRKIGAGDQESSRGFQAGETALLEVLDFQRQEGDSPVALAEAIADLADWYLIFQRRRNASALYAEAWQVLSETENSEELLANFFGQVVPLPTFLAAPTSLVFNSSIARDTSELQVGYADVVFDVTENGIVRDLEVVGAEEDDGYNIIGKLRREVRGSIFRPIVKDGETIRTSGNQFRYRFWY